MLAIRLQRVGRKKQAQYRLIAQEHSLQPTSGKVAAYLGSYNPHTKDAALDKEKIAHYLGNGAQPSNSAAKLLQRQGIELPAWVTITTKEPKKVEEPEAPATEEVEPDATVEETAEEPAEATEETPAEAEAPAEEAQAEEASEEPAASPEAEEKPVAEPAEEDAKSA